MLTGPAYPVNYITLSPDSKHAVSDFPDETMRIWDAESGKYLWYLENLVKSISFYTVSKDIISYGEHFYDPSLHIRYTSFQSLLSTLAQSTPTKFYALLLSPTSTSLHLHTDGWVCTSREYTGVEHRIIWIPHSLRPFDPRVLMVISQTGFNRIDLSGCTFGDGWSGALGAHM
ncbi:hypothetical protein DL96DRAFT_1628392 [Flagelloscypha sp. PMI_526]|nr:hypothetical protein DL96DRAFT_1628392 [Flagelloscypha sp. PMI_526]